MQVQPYLCFEGRCEEAIEFYRTALGAEVSQMMRFKDIPGPGCPGEMPGDSGNKVMHACLQIGGSAVMMSDGQCQGTPDFKGVSLALQVPTEAAADRLFANLAAGGQVQMPLDKTFWSPKFGMVADKFGVSWMVNVTG